MKRLTLSRSVIGISAVAVILAGCGGGQPAAPQLPVTSAPIGLASVAEGAQRVSPDGIVYAPADVLIQNSQYNLDLNNVGITDFVIAESNRTSKPMCRPIRGGMNETANLWLTGQGSNGVEISNGRPAKLISGSPIGPSQSFTTGSLEMESSFIMWRYVGFNCESFTGAAGNWFPNGGRGGYLGLAFEIHGETHYGWAAIKVGGGYGFLAARLKGYAYQTKAGKSIMAGQM